MKIARFLLVSIPIILSCLVAPLLAQDPGNRDTVKIGGGDLVVGQSRPIELIVSNDESLEIINFGLILRSLDGGFARWDSVVFINRLADPYVMSYRFVQPRSSDPHPNVSPDTVIFGCLKWFGASLPPGNSAIMRLYFTGLQTGTIATDTGFFFPSGAPILQAEHYTTAFIPKFVFRNIRVTVASLPPALVLPDTAIRALAGTSFEIPVVASSPASLPLNLSVISVSDEDNNSRLPANAATIVSGNPQMFTWQSDASDLGIWVARISACDSTGSCTVKEMEFQLVASQEKLLSFQSQEITNTCSVTGFVHGDFDNDGQYEVFAAGSSDWNTPPAELYKLNGSGALVQAYHEIRSGTPRIGPHACFLNTDSYLDVVSMGLTQGGWRIVAFKGNGNDNFVTDSASPQGIGPRSTALCEFTGDNHLDFVSVWVTQIDLYAGNSQGNFDLVGYIFPPDSALSINAADFNHDGFDDLAIGTIKGLEIYLANGSGGFNHAFSYSQTYGSRDVVVTNEGSDFNGDGKYDLCISTPSVGGAQSQLLNYWGNANGSFSPHVVRTVNGQIFGNCVGDFDGDGKLDIAFVNSAKQYVAILLGDGTGGFPNEIRYKIPWRNPQRIDCLDIDLDGDLDLVVAANITEVGNKIFLLTNQTIGAGYVANHFEITSHDNASLELTSPSGKILSDLVNTVPASSYYKRNLDQNALMDDYLSLSLIEDGKYTLRALPKPNIAPGQTFDLEFSIGTEKFRLAQNAPMTPAGYTFDIYPGSQTAVTPRPGKFTNANPPTFSWQGSGSFDFQLATDIGFTNLLANVTVAASSFKPANPLAGPDSAIYYWRVKPHTQPTFKSIYSINISDNATAVAGDANSSALPLSFNLGQNYPNPFNPSTAISYSIASRAFVSIEVFNLLGQRIATLVNETKMPGAYTARWDGRDVRGSSVPSGIYFYRLRAGDFVESKRMILLK